MLPVALVLLRHGRVGAAILQHDHAGVALPVLLRHGRAGVVLLQHDHARVVTLTCAASRYPASRRMRILLRRVEVGRRARLEGGGCAEGGRVCLERGGHVLLRRIKEEDVPKDKDLSAFSASK